MWRRGQEDETQKVIMRGKEDIKVRGQRVMEFMCHEITRGTIWEKKGSQPKGWGSMEKRWGNKLEQSIMTHRHESALINPIPLLITLNVNNKEQEICVAWV